MKRSPQFFYARQMRNNMTFEERLFWNKIREQSRYYGRWRRQVPMLNYIVDFCCHEHQLIVEIDGGQHHSGVDDERDTKLTAIGYQILRYSNYTIKTNISAVLDDIFSRIPPPITSLRS